MHRPGRYRAQLPLGRALSTLRPPIHARARGAAAWDAIRGSLGRPLGRHRPHGGAPPGLRSRARAPRARASRVACCRPLATAYEHAVRRRLLLPRSFIPTTSGTHPPTIEFFPPLPPAWDAGGCPPRPLGTVEFLPLCRRLWTPAAAPPPLRATVDFFPPSPPASDAGGFPPLSATTAFFPLCHRRGTPAAAPPPLSATVAFFPRLPPAWHAGGHYPAPPFYR